MSQPVPAPSLARLPFCGRTQDLARLRGLMEDVRRGRGTTVFLSGEPGVGKSRLAALIAEDARRDGWHVAPGRAYPAESGVPYALFSDAIVPTLRELGREKLSLLTRGSEDELEILFPLLRAERPTRAASQRTPESNLQLHWIFAQLLKALAARRRLLGAA